MCLLLWSALKIAQNHYGAGPYETYRSVEDKDTWTHNETHGCGRESKQGRNSGNGGGICSQYWVDKDGFPEEVLPQWGTEVWVRLHGWGQEKSRGEYSRWGGWQVKAWVVGKGRAQAESFISDAVEGWSIGRDVAEKRCLWYGGSAQMTWMGLYLSSFNLIFQKSAVLCVS